MPAISNEVRFVISIIVGICGFVAFGLIALLLEPNFRYLLRRVIPGEIKVGEPPTKRPKITWGLFWLTAIISGMGAAFLSAAPSIEDTIRNTPMTGDFRVAIANFTRIGNDLDSGIDKDIANGIYQRLEQSLQQSNMDLILEIREPDLVGIIKGKNRTERASTAQALAQKIEADILIYGEIEIVEDALQITPQFYVTPRNYYEAEEITGQHDLGSPVIVSGYEDLVDRVNINNKLSARTRALSQMIIGLAYYSLEEYDNAISIFENAQTIEGWDANEGKEVLYLFIGNSAIRKDDPSHENLNIAEDYFSEALEIQPDYSRALLGLSNVYYRKALLPIEVTNDPEALDVGLITKALNLLGDAITSPNQPPSSDIGTKYHFELGQNYFALAYSGNSDSYEDAIKEFKLVIEAYGEGANPRIKERAAEAHARLGLIYSLAGDKSSALSEYETALELSNSPERKKIFEERIIELGGSRSDS